MGELEEMATGKVVQWLRANPELRADLRKVADGDKFTWGDCEVAEMVDQLSGKELNSIGLSYMRTMKVDRAAARQFGREMEAMAGRSWMGTVDWVEVRKFLIGEA